LLHVAGIWDIMGLTERTKMKIKINVEWRKKDEPEFSPEETVRTALKAAGYTVGHISVQGVWDEDKPARPQGPWDGNRLPHEMVVFTGAK